MYSVMNLPKPPNTFQTYNKIFLQKPEEIMKIAAHEAISENEGNKDIAAVFDGSWQKFSMDSWKVLNAAVCFAKYCSGCEKKNWSSDLYKDVCSKNYQGYSGGIKISGAFEASCIKRKKEK